MVPDYSYSIVYSQTPFEVLRPLYYRHEGARASAVGAQASDCQSVTKPEAWVHCFGARVQGLVFPAEDGLGFRV